MLHERSPSMAFVGLARRWHAAGRIRTSHGTRFEPSTARRHRCRFVLQPVVQRLAERATLVLFDDADHAFHVRARSGRTDAQTLNEMLDAMASWMRARVRAA